MNVEYLRKTVYGSIMSINELESLGEEGWIMCAAVKMTDIQYNYLFYRFKSNVYITDGLQQGI